MAQVEQGADGIGRGEATMTTPTTQVWSDERITSEAEALAAFWKQHETPLKFYRRDIKTCLTQVRDDYEQALAARDQRIAELEAHIEHLTEINTIAAQTISTLQDYRASLSAQVARLQGEVGG